MKNKKYFEWINILRGFAIFLIVLGHAIGYSKNLSILSKYLSSFYVPLFFFISGYIINENSDEKLIPYIKRKAKKILIPYFVFATITLIPYYLFASNIQSNLASNKNISNGIITSLLNILYGSGHGEGLSQNTPIWFLPCFFLVVVIGKLTIDIFKKYQNKHKNLFISILFLTIGGIFYKYLNYPYPFGFETALVMLYFYFLGSYIKKIHEPLTNKKKFVIGIIAVIIGFIIQTYNGRISARYNDYENSYLIFVSSATFTCIGYCYLFSLIKKCNILSYLGKHTIPVLVTHKMPLVFFQTYFGVITYYLKNGNSILQFSCAIFISVLSIILSIIVYKIINKYFPILYGNDSTKNKNLGIIN